MAGGIVSASYPLAVRAVESGDAERARRQLLANGSLLLSVMAPACLGMALTADGAANTLVGHAFAPTVALLMPWMAIGAFFASMRAHFLDHAFQLGRRPGLQVLVTAVAAIIAIGLSIFLIPRYGPVGGAIAVTIAMAVSCVHASLAGRLAYPVPLPLAAAGRVLVAFAAQVVVGVAAYGAAAFALNLLDLRSAALSFIARRARRAPSP